ncbi:MAG: fumarylacetoacetate hydrolase family protein [Chloroflexi bacterium]|nr:fumarylacetoacetate hydrolase family protein [Chloroflexota bacterium]
MKLAVPKPLTIRDFYAFEAHVRAARARRGLDMIPEWYEMPVFYFGNPNAVYGHDEEIPYPSATHALDFELEVAVVIGEGGRNIPVERADEHIAGFTIMNDWSARDIQREEMKVGLGPAKGKDFATSLGPWLVTPDELADRREPAPPRNGSSSAGRPGDGRERGYHYRLEMNARVDGNEVSRGNLVDLYWTFAEMIAYASRDCTLYPDEVIGSGTVGTGCLLELGLPWLKPGQVVELEVERLGVLRNTVGLV